MSSAVDSPAGEVFVSTGELPTRELVESLVREAHDRYRANREGEISQAYPALAGVRADLFGVCVAERLAPRLWRGTPTTSSRS